MGVGRGWGDKQRAGEGGGGRARGGGTHIRLQGLEEAGFHAFLKDCKRMRIACVGSQMEASSTALGQQIRRTFDQKIVLCVGREGE